VFSLNFSLAGKGPFMASKANNFFRGGGGGRGEKKWGGRGATRGEYL